MTLVVDHRALVQELTEQAGLSPDDARRAAFCAIAWSRGWSGARIGRYLGVTRVRVSQRFEKLQRYAREFDCPTLSALLERPRGKAGDGWGVGFEHSDWDRPEFADALLAWMAHGLLDGVGAEAVA